MLNQKENSNEIKKIPCYVRGFLDFETIKKCVDYLIRFNDRLELNIIENYSDYTESHFKPYMLNLLEQGKINSYYLFEEDIGINATEVVLRFNSKYIETTDYIMITDGDLTCEDDSWLDESMDIIKNNPEVFCVGAELDMSNLPPIEGAKGWVPKAVCKPDKPYNAGFTGWWFSIYRSKEIMEAFNIILNKNLKFTDIILHQYCSQTNRIWARPKQAKTYHITWDVYMDPENPYNKWKKTKTLYDIYNPPEYCGFTLYNKKGNVYHNLNL